MKRILRVKVSRFQDIFDIVSLTHQMHIRRSSFNRKRRRSSFNPRRLRLRHTHYGFPFRIQVSVSLLEASKKRIQNCFLLSLHNVSLQRRPINAKQHITLTYFVFGSTNVKYGSWQNSFIREASVLKDPIFCRKDPPQKVSPRVAFVKFLRQTQWKKKFQTLLLAINTH